MKNKLTLCLLAFIFSSCASKEELKFRQYMNQGKRLYNTNCANCHQPDGSGLGQLFPPLTNDFSKKNKALIICGIRYGIEGPLEINGTTYNGQMPPNVHLSHLEIAEIITYINNSWGNNDLLTSTDQVKKALNFCDH